MRGSEKRNGDSIFKNWFVSFDTVSRDQSLKKDSANVHHQYESTFFTTRPPMLCATKIVCV